MLQGLKNLSKGAKIGIGTGAGVLALALTALGVWQPWKQEAPPAGDQQGPGTVQPQPGDAQNQDQEPVTLRVGNQEIPCTVYEKDGWSLYIPEDWSAQEDGQDAMRFTAPEGPSVYVLRIRDLPEDEPPLTAGTYACLRTAGDGLERYFYTGDERNAWSIACAAPAADWQDWDALFRAIARTGGLDGGTPFSGWTPMPAQPDWQDVDGDTVLFMDKDGIPLSGEAEQAVRARMRSWPDEEKDAFTGQYQFQLDWYAGYVRLGDSLYVDVFRTEVSYEVKDGADGSVRVDGGRELRDGWLREDGALYVAVAHDGSRADKTVTLWLEAAPDAGALAQALLAALE